MRLPQWLMALGIGALLVSAGSAQAETKVVVKGVHLCCPACTKAVGEILKKVDGVKGKCDTAKKTVTITATDDQAAQKALDALAEGGFHGTTDNKDLAIKEVSDAPKGKVKSLKVTEVHNCCGQCCRAIKAAVKKVDGVTGDTAKPKGTSFEINGDFDAEEAIKALTDAGFHVKVSK